MIVLPLSIPATETAPYVRPAVSSPRRDIAVSTVLGDPAQTLADAFIRGLVGDPREGAISPLVASFASAFLREMRRTVPELPVPTIAEGPSGYIGLTWEANGHHVNVEIYPDGHVENFWENLATGELGSEEVHHRRPTPRLLDAVRATL